MKVQAINRNTNFMGEKRRFIDKESRNQLTQILQKMDDETIYKSNEYSFDSTRTKRLSLFEQNKQIAELIDFRIFLNKIPQQRQSEGNTGLTIGKTELVIENKTGEIIDYYKPFYKCWKNIMKQINETLTTFNVLFNNPKAVKKNKLTVSGFTKKGFEVLFKMKVK